LDLKDLRDQLDPKVLKDYQVLKGLEE